MRQDWGIRESVGQQAWQDIMRQYLRQDRQEAAKLAAELAGANPSTPVSRRKQTGASTEGASTCLSYMHEACIFLLVSCAVPDVGLMSAEQ